jgi:hypothetical protein
MKETLNQQASTSHYEVMYYITVQSTSHSHTAVQELHAQKFQTQIQKLSGSLCGIISTNHT